MRTKLSNLTVAMLAMLLMLPAQVMAQGARSTGSISGQVTDADGAGLPGATATIEGDTLIQESVSVTTDLAGDFRFRNLRPGTYIVTVALTGFQSVAYNVPVSVGGTSSVIAQMELAGVSETVTVISETPLIDLESASLTTSYGSDLMENMPAPREFSEITNFAPGFADKGAYGAGGDHSEGSSTHRIGAATNGYRLNGVDVNEGDWGSTWINPNVDSIAEIQIVGIGASAEYGNFTGAMINMVTKGGTNEFHGTGSFYWENGSLRSDNSGGIIDLERGKFSYDREYSATFGGPIVRNKMLFFASAARQESLGSNVADQIWIDGGIAPEDAQQGNNVWRLHGRLDYLINDRHTLGAMINHDPGGGSNESQRPGSPLIVGMDTSIETTTWLLSWQAQLGDNTFTDLRFAGYTGAFIRLPIKCQEGPPSANPPGAQPGAGTGCDVPDYWFGGSRRLTRGFLEDEDNARKEITATVTQYVDNFLGAAHDVKVGIAYNDSWSSWISSYTGEGGLYTYGYHGGYLYVYAYYYDVGLEAQIVRSSAFIQDNATPSDNLTLNLGLRYDRTNGYDRTGGRGGERTDVSADWAPAGSGLQTKYYNLAPRLGFTWDLSGDGRAVVHGSWGRYFEKVAIGHISRASGGAFRNELGYKSYASYFYDATDFFDSSVDLANLTDAQAIALQDATFVPANLRTQDAPQFPIPEDLHSLHTDVWNIGFEYEFVRDWVVGIDYIHKDDSNFFNYDDQIDHQFTAFDYTAPDTILADGSTVTGQSQTLYNKDTGFTDQVFTNSPYYIRTHDIVTLLLDRRRTGSGLNFSSSITYQNNRGTKENGDGQSVWGRGFDQEDNPNFNGHPFAESGPLRFSRAWSWKILANYRLPGDVLAGMYFNWASGRPWNLQQRNSRIGLLNADYSNSAIEQVGGRRWDSLKQVDLRLSKSFNLGDSSRFELMLDGFNLLNDFSPTSVQERRDRTYNVHLDSAGNRVSAVGSPRVASSLLPGRQFRLGARISF